MQPHKNEEGYYVYENCNLNAAGENVTDKGDKYEVLGNIHVDDLLIDLDKPLEVYGYVTAYGEFKSNVSVTVHENLKVDSSIEVEGSLTAKSIISEDLYTKVTGQIETIEKGPLSLQASGEISCGSLKVAGWISCDGTLEVGLENEFGGSVDCGGNIRVESVEVEGSIKVVGGITALGHIHAKGFIKCDYLESKTNITTDSSIDAVHGILAHGRIYADGTVKAGGKVFAGVSVQGELSDVDQTIQCSELINGTEIGHGIFLKIR